MNTSSIDPDRIAAVAELMRAAEDVLFVTGAGMSADSGLPTYRGIGGLYDRGPTDEGVPIEVALSGEMFRARPALSWKYISQIEQACRGARFNRGHLILARLEQLFRRACVLTQNVDGFHRDAGSSNVIEIHGNLRTLDCTRCTWTAQMVDYAELGIPPHCPDCEAIVRPRVVLFGEMLPTDAIEHLHRELDSGFDLVVNIGTSAVFPYIAQPVVAAHRVGVPTVEIDPSWTIVSDLVDHRLQAEARLALEALWATLEPDSGLDQPP